MDDFWKEKLSNGPLSDSDARTFAEFALTRVSRTFALNIRVLPLPLRTHVLYAYLYCRMADTLEDDPHLEPPEKIRLLQQFSALFIAPRGKAPSAMQEFTAQLPTQWQSSPQWEHLLLVDAPVVLSPFLDFPEPVRKIVAGCVSEMCAGMADFAGRHAGAASPHLIATVAELDTYCYYVAGTVGMLLCELFILHSGRINPERAAKLRGLCVSFGLGLQLTNILKDLHDDKDRNVSWLPTELLAIENLSFQDFLHSPAASRGRKRIYRVLFLKAKKHLEDALEYSCLIPRFDNRLRLFCLWPLFMAAETLALLADSTEALAQGTRLKISRNKVKSIVQRTGLLGWSNRWVHAEFQKPMRRLENSFSQGTL